MIHEYGKGLETYYTTHGEKGNPAVLLLHGLGAEMNMWSEQISLLEDHGYHVIALDLLCHGQSSHVEHLSLEAWNEQIKTLLASIAIKKIAIVGIGMGGVIAQHFAVTNKNLVDALVTCDSYGELETIYDKFTNVVSMLGLRFFQVMGRNAFVWYNDMKFNHSYAIKAWEYFMEVSYKQDIREIIKVKKAINKAVPMQELKGLKIPALVMVGEHENKHFIDVNKRIAKHLRVSDFLVLGAAKKPSNLTNPLKFDGALLKFLRDVYYN